MPNHHCPVCKDIPKQSCVKKGHLIKCAIHNGHFNPRDGCVKCRDQDRKDEEDAGSPESQPSKLLIDGNDVVNRDVELPEIEPAEHRRSGGRSSNGSMAEDPEENPNHQVTRKGRKEASSPQGEKQILKGKKTKKQRRSRGSSGRD